MEYKVEDLSPVKKKVAVTVPVEEVEAAIASTIAMYRTNVDLKGFRKGKVPSSVIEGRFRKDIYAEASQELVNVHINEIMGETEANPVSRIDFDGDDFERGKVFEYTLSFEVMPTFELPDYDGMEVEEEAVEENEDEVNEVIERIRGNLAEVVPVAESRPAKEGEIAVIDFTAYENGEPVEGTAAQNFEMPIGDKQALDAFEELVKSIAPGEEKEGEVTFPEDFLNPEFAGKTMTMKVKVHAVKEKRMPELDDELAQKAGGFESVEKMREAVTQSYMQSRTQLSKSQAQKSMLDSLLKGLDFPLPDSMVDMYIDNLIQEQAGQLERQGKSLDSLGKKPEELREEKRPEAEQIAKTQIFLVTVAQKEGVEVSEQEVDMQLYQMSMRTGQEFKALKDYYVRNNLIFTLRDRLLADKAMDAIYEKAEVKKIEAKPLDAEAAE